LDEKGKGMSKSKGNVVWADEILKKYSVDAFRYWVGTASLGSDLPFKEKDLVAGQKFLTKLWNASRFSLSHLRDYEYKNPAKPEVMDKWVLTKLSALVEDVKRHYTSYNIAEAKKKTENFFWHLFCDNYLEIVKDRLYNSDSRGKQAKESAQYGLYTALLAILKLIAPITPHITEEIYHLYFAGKEGKKSIHISDWPRFDKKMVDKEAESAGDLAIELIAAVRRFKSENKLPLTAEIKKLTVNCDEAAKKRIRIVEKDLKATAKIKEVAFGKGDTEIRTGLRIGIFT
jgi:valyl-tRNA synthetase